MRLKELRQKSGLTQADIAKIAKCSQSNYSKYEIEKLEPDIATIINLANYYNVSLDYLCDRQWNNQIEYIPDEKKEVVKLILQLNQTNTIKVFGFVSGLLATQN